MSITIIPRRSVRIEAWNATSDDLLKVVMSNHTVYYIRAAASGFEAEPYFWFDLEFMPPEIREFAKSTIAVDLAWAHRLPGESDLPGPSNDEIEQVLRLDHGNYRFEDIDYDISLVVNFYYGMSELRQWHDPNNVIRIEPITRDEARAERADKPTPR